jgi:hypothetical protein
VAADDAQALGVETDVVCEHGRWVVYLVVTTWNPAAGDDPLRRRRLRIRDHATQAEAEMTRRCTERVASRDCRLPPLGF